MTTFSRLMGLPVLPAVASVRLRRFSWLLLALLMVCAAADASARTVSKEYQIKAAFLYNFTKFVEWPAERFSGADDAIVIAVLGKNPFGDALENAVKGRLVNNRPIQVRFIESAAELPGAHIVFVAPGAENLLPDDATARHGLLTVGESAGFAADGGIIRFVLADEKVRFEINQRSGEQAGLKLSGQLLKLATVIRTQS